MDSRLPTQEARNLAGSSARVILFVGEKTDCPLQRNTLQRGPGYNLQVISAPEAIRKLDRTKVDLIVLGHTLSEQERLRLQEIIQQLRSRPRVILLYHSRIDRTERADAVLNANGDPEDLMRTIEYLLTGGC